MNQFYTAESVTEGHPDKLCDLIADSVLDDCLSHDALSRVACEVLATKGQVIVAGEITSLHEPQIPAIVRSVLRKVGYDPARYAVQCLIHKQSPDIAAGVDCSLEQRRGSLQDPVLRLGAGDQGVMVGYACSETPQMLPLPVVLAHRLAGCLTTARKSGMVRGLRPDGKAQVTVEYRDGIPARVDTVVVSSQHEADVSMEQLREDILRHVIRPVIPEGMLDRNTKFFINPTGRFCIGGPAGDSGLTGRKLIVDTYGGYARHGGGAFSGKDPSKVDRSGAYMARYLAKNVVAAGLADRCEIQISYAIGVAQPVSLLVDTFGTGKLPADRIRELILKTVDLRPSAIIDRLSLRTPFYRHTASYGHFGSNTAELPWEQTNLPQLWQDII